MLELVSQGGLVVLESLLKANSLFVGMTLYVLSVGIIFVGRRILEGRFYNVAFSSWVGDAFLIGIILITKGVLTRDSASSYSLCWHAAAIVSSLLVGILVNWIVPAKQWMDIYHNLVVIPLLFYLVVFVSSYTILFHGSPMQKVVAAACFIMWFALAVYDWTSGRIDQRVWLGSDFFR